MCLLVRFFSLGNIKSRRIHRKLLAITRTKVDYNTKSKLLIANALKLSESKARILMDNVKMDMKCNQISAERRYLLLSFVDSLICSKLMYLKLCNCNKLLSYIVELSNLDNVSSNFNKNDREDSIMMLCSYALACLDRWINKYKNFNDPISDLLMNMEQNRKSELKVMGTLDSPSNINVGYNTTKASESGITSTKSKEAEIFESKHPKIEPYPIKALYEESSGDGISATFGSEHSKCIWDDQTYKEANQHISANSITLSDFNYLNNISLEATIKSEDFSVIASDSIDSEYSNKQGILIKDTSSPQPDTVNNDKSDDNHLHNLNGNNILQTSQVDFKHKLKDIAQNISTPYTDFHNKSDEYILTSSSELNLQLQYTRSMWMRETTRATNLSDQLESLKTKYNHLKESYLILMQKNDALQSRINFYEMYKSENLPNLDTHDEFTLKKVKIKDDTHVNNIISRSSVISRKAIEVNKSLYSNGNRNTLENMRNLILNNEWICYEDKILQIGISSTYTDNTGHICIYFGNKFSFRLENFEAIINTNSINSTSLDICLTYNGLVHDYLLPNQQIYQEYSIKCLELYEGAPKLLVNFLLPDNTPQKLVLFLPIVISKFMSPIEKHTNNFVFELWHSEQFLYSEVTNEIQIDKDLQGNLSGIIDACKLGNALQVFLGNNDNTLVSESSIPDSYFFLVGSFKQLRVVVKLEFYSTSAKVCNMRVRADSPLFSCIISSLIYFQLSSSIMT
ncbi:uncharacterized protein CMU_023580 [Cryptosporidium muris RN66]|uniref:Clathrin adaptor alpha/beta/gamma-adaptin appendage Ig-like subdomain domain-containing protein n=1 Tax=Cryptosporidium muris (strain RN66) TaxID=441375 RepID=B6AC00_CRYMR|nr:uncharacterized protein CMU_023580 [Cryptosporidium muris RN66]EEA05353.1 hypothetical protein, conserved [Cryptosporidium muris RN66]|eukprot:XP_002139702.1 hypothetical protein [Cryptosporidium muris RN66]